MDDGETRIWGKNENHAEEDEEYGVAAEISPVSICDGSRKSSSAKTWSEPQAQESRRLLFVDVIFLLIYFNLNVGPVHFYVYKKDKDNNKYAAQKMGNAEARQKKKEEEELKKL